MAWLLAPLAAGASLVLCRYPFAERLPERAAAERVTATLGRQVDGVRELGRTAERGVTFSVLARDPATGDLGIAVSSCILAVGRAVPSARPGVGVVAVQARSRRGLGALAARRARRRQLPRGRWSAAPPTPPRTRSGRSPSSTPRGRWPPTPAPAPSRSAATSSATGFSVQGNMLAGDGRAAGHGAGLHDGRAATSPTGCSPR